MTKPILAALAMLAAAFGALPAQADDEEDWAGLYAGIDAVDGSFDHLSIVPLGNGTFDIRVLARGLGHCGGGTQDGLILATGRLVDGQLRRENVKVKCAGSDELFAVDDGVYRRDRKTGILTIESIGGRVLYYHRLGED